MMVMGHPHCHQAHHFLPQVRLNFCCCEQVLLTENGMGVDMEYQRYVSTSRQHHSKAKQLLSPLHWLMQAHHRRGRATVE